VKLALISDIHANLEALQAVFADIDAEGVDDIVCLGDIVGYGADPNACLDLLRDRQPRVIVQGNHDVYAGDERDLAAFNPLAAAATLWTRERLGPERRQWLLDLPLDGKIEPDITLVHATPSDPAGWDYVRFLADGALAIADQVTPFCFFGHTHVPMAFRHDGTRVEQLIQPRYDIGDNELWLVNVGSVGQPRDGDWRAAWTLFDGEARTISLRRVEYDVETCMLKIVGAGLPDRLAERLAQGR
jgi:diadenosine tetraphosphatase ApaH/serine/threonine PP2A family protein phosphatase